MASLDRKVVEMRDEWDEVEQDLAVFGSDLVIVCLNEEGEMVAWTHA